MPVCRVCGVQFPNRVEVEGKVRIINRRKYCLSCSPFGQHNTRCFEVKPVRYKCGTCGETDPKKFYGNKTSWCGTCHNRYTLEAGRQKRDRVVDLLGCKCVCCGFHRFACALDVHHLDPANKDHAWAAFRGWAWERIEKEIVGCVLLCKNCHAAVHAGLIAVPINAGV